jgi:predicted HicB family RNase H-like nuclease
MKTRLGRPPKKGAKQKPITVYFPPEILKKLRAQADREGRSLSNMVIRIVEAHYAT